MEQDIGNTKNKTDIIEYDIIIIGCGVIGMFAYTKFSQAGFSTCIIESSGKFGGQCNLYLEKKIVNIPLTEEIMANDVKNKLFNDIQKTNIANNIENSLFFNSRVVAIDTKDDNGIYITTDDKKEFHCKYLIIACGNGEIVHNKLPIENAKFFENKTLFYEVLNTSSVRGKNIMIAGGGDSAIDWAVGLSCVVNDMLVLHRREIVKPDNANFQNFQHLCQSNQVKTKIPYTIIDIQGNKETGNIEKVIVLNNDTKQTEEIAVDYLFAFYGLQNKQVVVLSKYKKVNGQTMESLECKNIFSVGDFADYEGKIKNIPIGFSEVIKCLNHICKLENSNINIYGKSNIKK